MSSQSAKFKWSVATILLAPRGGQAPCPTRDERRNLFAWAAAAGFGGIEISPRWYNIYALQEEALGQLRRDVEEAGLSFSGINVERAIVVRSERAAENRDRIRLAIDIAPVIGATLVDVALALDWEGVGTRSPVTSRDFSDGNFEAAVAEIRALTRYASGKGIAISIELHDDGLLDEAALCRRFIEVVGQPNCGANPDVGNICRSPCSRGDWETALRILAPITNCWHVKNYKQGCPAPLENGDIDYAQAMEIMIDAGYSGWVSIESRLGEFRETQSRAIEYLRAKEREIHAKKCPVLEPVRDA
jgi:sugar phosphate isomerase/epimerase